MSISIPSESVRKQENHRFSDDLKGYRNVTLDKYGLISSEKYLEFYELTTEKFETTFKILKRNKLLEMRILTSTLNLLYTMQ